MCLLVMLPFHIRVLTKGTPKNVLLLLQTRTLLLKLKTFEKLTLHVVAYRVCARRLKTESGDVKHLVRSNSNESCASHLFLGTATGQLL